MYAVPAGVMCCIEPVYLVISIHMEIDLAKTTQ